MKILILGSSGMAGHMIVRYLSEKNHDIKTVARHNADFLLNVEDKERVEDFLTLIENQKFDFIINCMGVLVKDSIDNPERAMIVNGWFPHAIERKFRDTNTKLIHLSTDCIFDGQRGNYLETDLPTEKNTYGTTKAYGEILNDKDVTFRMSIIGPEIKNNGTGLFNWIYNNEDSELSGWENALWNGVTTLQLAKCIEQYINDPKITGIYHLVNNDVSINKYDLLCKINDIFNLGKYIKRTQGPKTVNKILLNTREDFYFDIPDYDTQLQELKEYVK